MGYYIEVPNVKGKAQQVIDIHGAELLERAPLSLSDIPPDKAVICVVDNGPFEAAGFCYNEKELQDFVAPDYFQPQRPRQWLLMDRSKACKLTGYKE